MEKYLYLCVFSDWGFASVFWTACLACLALSIFGFKTGKNMEKARSYIIVLGGSLVSYMILAKLEYLHHAPSGNRLEMAVPALLGGALLWGVYKILHFILQEIINSLKPNLNRKISSFYMKNLSAIAVFSSLALEFSGWITALIMFSFSFSIVFLATHTQGMHARRMVGLL